MNNGKDYIKHFDEIFETNLIDKISLKNFETLKLIFDTFGEDLYKPTPKYENIRNDYIEISSKLESTFTDEQKELHKQIYNLNGLMTEELELHLFIFGYILGNGLKLEVKKELIKDEE